jgi:acetylornithine deacetylase/succinyl-diaminopimelate desuccinylase-like protein
VDAPDVTADETEVAITPVPLSRQQLDWIDRALGAIDEDALVRLVTEMVEIPSPTGDEATLARFLVDVMRGRGIDAFYQEIDDHRGNSIGRLRGRGDGADLLFYGHLDTTFTGNEDDDYPVIGPSARPDLQPHVRCDGDLLIGLGAANPKGADACAIMALDAVRRADVPLRGDVLVGLAVGGIHKRPIKAATREYRGRAYLGFGLGCEFMLKHGIHADHCINTKPGYSVVWEEPGECWFSVQTRGALCYSGLRHTIQRYRNPIADAGTVVAALETWFPEYTRSNTRGLIAPQGAVGAIEAGWPFKPEFVPAICNVYADVRTNARVDVLDVKRQFGETIASVRQAHPDIDVTWDMIMSVPGSRTPPTSWIVQSCLRAWEAVEKRPHVFARELSGTTDGNILRAWGMPTARLGLPGLMNPDPTWPPMFDACRIDDLVRLTKCYVYALIDTCTRARGETR